LLEQRVENEVLVLEEGRERLSRAPADAVAVAGNPALAGCSSVAAG
jgi:hypothetical protein